MNIIFMRHGEATDNIKELISDKEIFWSTLTEVGIETIQESIKYLPKKIDKIYVSPLPRTIETANIVSKFYPKTEIIIDEKIREINNGKYSGQKNNKDLDNTRIKQINGDYFCRFGEYGENKFAIEKRLCEFLKNMYTNNFNDNTILIITHGSITSYMKRILKIKTPHLQTGKIEEFKNVDFKKVDNHIKTLLKIKKETTKEQLIKIKELNINNRLKKNINNIIKNEFNNLEFPIETINNYIDGLSTKKLRQLTNPNFEKDIILICFYNNFENLAKKWINHYINIGIKNFVLIDNNSTDKSTKILKRYSNDINISFWTINEKYNCYKMCGWKQQILEYYGKDKYYLTVDSDELLIYENFKETKLKDFVKINKLQSFKTIMLDVYSNKPIYEGYLDDFKYVDEGTYKITESVPYKQRVFGGPRTRIFGIKPSLQKIPFIKYSGKEVYINDHYYYPWDINSNAKFCSYLLHYKFLPEDKEKYERFVTDGRHWKNSREYKIYNSILNKEKTTFYNKDISINIENINFKFKN